MYRKKINVPMPNSQVQFEVDIEGMRVLKFGKIITRTALVDTFNKTLS